MFVHFKIIYVKNIVTPLNWSFYLLHT